MWGPCAEYCDELRRNSARRCTGAMGPPPPPPPHTPDSLRTVCGACPPRPRDASEGQGPQRQPQRRLDTRLEEVAEAVGGGYCRLQMPLKLALGVRGTVAGHRVSALGGGGNPPPSNVTLPPTFPQLTSIRPPPPQKNLMPWVLRYTCTELCLSPPRARRPLRPPTLALVRTRPANRAWAEGGGGVSGHPRGRL